jgi:hypothetical protein
MIIKLQKVEEPGIEPGAFHMQSERSTTELHPLPEFYPAVTPTNHYKFLTCQFFTQAKIVHLSQRSTS